jgi:Na+/phosphate symporter
MNDENFEKKLTAAYDKMMERLNDFLDDAEQQALPTLQRNLDKAKQQAIELKELTHDEAEKVAAYLHRDLHDAAEYLESSGKTFSNWLTFDLQLVEERMLELFASVADKTRLELEQLAQQAEKSQQYHTGEITGIGTLYCESCGCEMHFKKTSRIPPCPKCHKTIFNRKKLV